MIINYENSDSRNRLCRPGYRNLFCRNGDRSFFVDVNTEKIENLKKGIIPIYEPGLEDMVHRNQQAGRLQFTTDLTECLDEVEVLFSAVGTPPDEDGSADLKIRA